MAEITDAAEEIADELFPPRPGGLVDRHRQRVAAEKAQAEQEQQASESPGERAYKAVKVAPESPEVTRAQTFTIGSGARAQVLPGSPYRYRATILVVTAASNVTLAQDENAALGGNGFILSAGIPLVIFSRAQLFAFNSGGAPVQVSVMAEIYGPEK